MMKNKKIGTSILAFLLAAATAAAGAQPVLIDAQMKQIMYCK